MTLHPHIKGGSCAPSPCSADDIVLEIKLPVPVKVLAKISDALGRIHGKDKLFMRQVGQMIQLYKPRLENPTNAPHDPQTPREKP